MRDQPNRILEFLTAPAKPAGDACRSNRRRRSRSRIELAWFDGRGWRSIPARLRDISRGGASVLSRVMPPLARAARIRLVEGEGSPWIEAQILDVEPETPRRNRVRMRFEEPCPSFLLGLAVLDVPDENDEAPAAPQQWVAWSTEASE